MRRGVHRLDRMHGWQRAEGDLWVNVVGINDGSIGMPATADEVVGHLTAEFRAQTDARGTDSSDLPEGIVIDPMCGMHVRLGPGAHALEHDGRTMGFCAAACRAAYAREHGLPVPA